MKRLMALLCSIVAAEGVWAHEGTPVLRQAQFYTLATTPLAIEGLTGDRFGNLYTGGRAAGVGVACPIWRVSLTNITPVVVGLVPTPTPTSQCNPAGIAIGPDGRLF